MGGRQRAGENDTRCAVHTEEPLSEGSAHQVAGYRRTYPVATGVAQATVVSAPCYRHRNIYSGTQDSHPGAAKAPDQMGEGQIDFHAPADGKKRKARRVCDITGMVEPWLREAFETSQTGHIIERNGKPVRDIHTEFKALCQSLHLVDFRFP